jgi:hypothetical protein
MIGAGLKRGRYAFLIALPLAVYVAVAVSLAGSVEVSPDEGTYAQAARLAMTGRLPYRDFAYSQAPVLPYVNGAGMLLLGFGVLTQRLLNALWGLVGLAVAMAVGRRVGRQTVAFAAGTFLVASPFWIHDLVLGNAFALSSLFVSLAALSAAGSGSPERRLAGIAIFGTLAAGCRLSMAPFGLVLAALMVTQLRSFRLVGMTAGFFALSAALVFGPFYLADPRAFTFWTIGFHLSSRLHRRGWLAVSEALLISPVLWLLLVLAAFTLVRAWRSGALVACFTLLASVTTIAANLLVRAPYGGYITPVVGVAVAASLAVVRDAWPSREIFVAASAAALALAAVVARRPLLRPESLAELSRAAAFVASRTPPTAHVVATMPEVPLEAGRAIVPGSEQGKFGFTEEMTDEAAARLHLFSLDTLVRALESPGTGAVVFSRYSSWNFGWSAPSLKPTSQEARKKIAETLDRRWRPAFVGDYYLVCLPR